MVDFFLSEPSGRIVMTGRCSEIEFKLQPVLPGTTIRRGVASLDDYFDGARVVPMPARPSAAHVFDWTMKRWRLDSERAWAAVRTDRDARLSASDWTTLQDVPLSDEQRSAWRDYRQALRDVTAQTDPLAIDWPKAPA